jgi:RNA polymerase sigma factor for flagellar operon FliA
MSDSGRRDSWPAKSQNQKFEALLPLAKSIAGSIARRCPRGLYHDILAAASVGAWDVVRKHGDRSREEVRKLATFRVRGAILDELRRIDWFPKRARAKASGSGLTYMRFPDMLPAERKALLGVPATQEDELVRASESAALFDALEALPEREREILVDIFCHDVQAKDLAKKYRVSEPRISQLKARALARLREALC